MSADAPDAVGGGGVLRVLTWNVHELRDDAEAVRRVLRAARPDVACLQETPRRVRPVARLAALARGSGLLHAAGDRAGAGTAVLVHLRTRVHAARTGALPVTGTLARRRGWAAATVSLPGTAAVHVASVHLGLDAAERVEHVRRLLAALPGALSAGAPGTRAGTPLVVAGDLNEGPGGAAWDALTGALRDPDPGSAGTYPAHRPRHRIDAVLAAATLEVRGYGVPDGVDVTDARRASDHLPVLAEVVLPPG